jgi:alcohol dehydrogenase (cytochrome c)
MRPVTPGAFALAALLLLAQGAARAAGEGPAPVAAATGETEWPMYNKNYAGQRYSPLDQIDKLNVGRLAEVCRAKVADGGPLHAGPVVVGGLIVVTAGSDTTAVDARDCSVRWKHSHAAEGPEMLPANRGVGYADGVVYRGTSDGRLLALDAQTGALRWKVKAADSSRGEYISSAPLVWNGRIYAGISLSEFGIRGRMAAYDTKDGREVWRFHTIPRGKETGAETWQRGDTAATGGGGLWTSYALDPAAAEVFIPVANPGPALDAGYRPGRNLFTNSLVVLDANTGKLKWWYQAVAGDFREWDLAAPPVLYDDAQGRKVVAIAGKDGYVQLIDRRTHKRIFKTSISHRRNDTKPLTVQGLRFCPGILGGVQWNSPSLDPIRRNLYVGSVEWCTIAQREPVKEVKAGQLAFGGRFGYDKEGPAGRVTALDADSGEVQWQLEHDAPIVGASLPTAGGLMFVGDLGGNLLALDSDKGTELRRIQTGGSIAGGIVSYQIEGKQYIALTSGNISRLTFGGVGTPSIVVLALDAQKSAAPTAPPPAAAASASPDDAGRGRKLYAANCSTCHGARGEGGVGPALQGVGARLGAARLAEWIKNPSAKMPRLYPAPLAERDVNDVSAFVVSTF